MTGRVVGGVAVESERASRAAAVELLTRARRVIEPAYRTAIDAMPADLRLIAGYHAGLWDADGRPGARPGKALRPALVLACARAAGGPDGNLPEHTVAVAVAVELMHDFTLLHDDVMDGGRTRRHRPAAWTVFGVPRAILTGDMLLARAMELVPTRSVTVLAGTLATLCRGQSADLMLQATSGDVGLAECLAMAEDKTGALLGSACELGAAAAGAEERDLARYQRFGRELGVAFQLADDVLGIWGDDGLTGKPGRADLAARKVTMPIAAALNAGNASSARLRDLYLSPGELTIPQQERVADLVEAAGGRAWALAEAGRRTDLALRTLAEARPEQRAAADLRLLAGLVSRRDR